MSLLTLVVRSGGLCGFFGGEKPSAGAPWYVARPRATNIKKHYLQKSFFMFLFYQYSLLQPFF